MSSGGCGDRACRLSCCQWSGVDGRETELSDVNESENGKLRKIMVLLKVVKLFRGRENKMRGSPNSERSQNHLSTSRGR